jgi:MEDS: MEthanogen/methylotroph, DcmR Sensory domain
MDTTWQRFQNGSAPSAHAVHVYEDSAELAESVATYLCAGFDAGEPAIVVATPEHVEAFADRLAGSDIADGLLLVADADSTLAALLEDGRPSRERFDEVIGGLLDQVEERFPGRRIRVFGEMVDLLCERGRTDAAVALEELWTSLGERRHFSLLCAYRLDVFDRRAQVSVLPAVCRAHSHVRTGADPARLHRAVDAALEEALGADIGKVYALIGEQIRERRVPAAQLALMWVSAQMPTVAERVLASARARYVREPAGSATL